MDWNCGINNWFFLVDDKRFEIYSEDNLIWVSFNRKYNSIYVRKVRKKCVRRN